MNLNERIKAIRHDVFSGNFDGADYHYKQYKNEGGKLDLYNILQTNPYPNSTAGKTYLARVIAYVNQKDLKHKSKIYKRRRNFK